MRGTESQVETVAMEDTMQNKYLTFRIGEEDYAFEIHYVTEIIGIQSITVLPDLPPFIKGVINLRGKVIPVIDIRLRFGMAERAYDERTCIVVVKLHDMTVGLLVDLVKEVVDILEEQIDPPPAVSKNYEARFVKGLGKMDREVKIIVNMDTLLKDDETSLIEETSVMGDDAIV